MRENGDTFHIVKIHGYSHREKSVNIHTLQLKHWVLDFLSHFWLLHFTASTSLFFTVKNKQFGT